MWQAPWDKPKARRKPGAKDVRALGTWRLNGDVLLDGKPAPLLSRSSSLSATGCSAFNNVSAPPDPGLSISGSCAGTPVCISLPLRCSLAATSSGRPDVRLRLVELQAGSFLPTSFHRTCTGPQSSASSVQSRTANSLGQLLPTSLFLAVAYVLFPDHVPTLLRPLLLPGLVTTTSAAYSSNKSSRRLRRSAKEQDEDTPASHSGGALRKKWAALRRRVDEAIGAAPAVVVSWHAVAHLLHRLAGPAALLVMVNGLWATIGPDSHHLAHAVVGLMAVAADYQQLTNAAASGRIPPGRRLENEWHRRHRRAAARLAPFLADLHDPPPLKGAADVLEKLSVAAASVVEGHGLCGALTGVAQAGVVAAVGLSSGVGAPRFALSASLPVYINTSPQYTNSRKTQKSANSSGARGAASPTAHSVPGVVSLLAAPEIAVDHTACTSTDPGSVLPAVTATITRRSAAPALLSHDASDGSSGSDATTHATGRGSGDSSSSSSSSDDSTHAGSSTDSSSGAAADVDLVLASSQRPPALSHTMHSSATPAVLSNRIILQAPREVTSVVRVVPAGTLQGQLVNTPSSDIVVQAPQEVTSMARVVPAGTLQGHVVSTPCSTAATLAAPMGTASHQLAQRSHTLGAETRVTTVSHAALTPSSSDPPLPLFGRGDHALAEAGPPAGSSLPQKVLYHMQDGATLFCRSIYLFIIFLPFFTLGVFFLFLGAWCTKRGSARTQSAVHQRRAAVQALRNAAASDSGSAAVAAKAADEAEAEDAALAAAAAEGGGPVPGTRPRGWDGSALRCREQAWKLLLWGCRCSGAAFIKWGQWSASRADLFPPDFCDALSALHDRAPVHGFRFTQREVEAAFGVPLAELFDDFEEEAFASGSIAQVHRAKLRHPPGGGSPLSVAVKVRHPNVATHIALDFRILKPLAATVGGLRALRGLSLKESVSQFSHTMTAQADLRVEAAHLQRFYDNFSGVGAQVTTPAPIPGMATEAVLVESFEVGLGVSHFIRNPSPINTRLVALGCDTYLAMLLKHNFVHTDLHPGNIMVRALDASGRPLPLTAAPMSADNASGRQSVPDALADVLQTPGVTPQLVLLDFGLAEELNPRVRHHFISFLNYVCSGNGRRAAHHLLRWAQKQDCPHPEAFAASMEVMFKERCNMSHPKGIDLDAVMKQVLLLAREHSVSIDSSYASLLLAVVVIVGFASALDARVNLLDAATPCFLLHALTGKVMGRLYD